MKKIFILSLLFSVSFILYSQSKIKLKTTEQTLGIGFLSFGYNTEYPIYVNEKAKKPFDTIIYKTMPKGEIEFESVYFKNEMPVNDIKKGHPPLNTFRVIENKKNYYKIIINEDTFETAVIKKDKTFLELNNRKEFMSKKDIQKTNVYIYETWENYLTRAEYIHADKTVIYDKPKGVIVFEKNYNVFPYEVFEISGDYMKINNYFSKSNKELAGKDIWIKWKDKDKLLVKVIEYLLR